MIYRSKIPAGNGFSTVLATMDFETFSEAGYYWDGDKPRTLQKNKKGIAIAGAAAYAEHPTTDVRCLQYDLMDGVGCRLWIPGTPPPAPLFDHIASGGIVEAHNSIFEYFIWHYVCHLRYGWPELPYTQLVDSMTKCYSFSLPGALEKAAQAIGSPIDKDKTGQALIRKLSCPRKPTKKLPYKRLLPRHDPKSYLDFYDYCATDVKAEHELSKLVPDLTPSEHKLWLWDQGVNVRGVHIDTEALANCESIVEQAKVRYTHELQEITGGAAQTSDELDKIKDWLAGRGVNMPDMTKPTVAATIPTLPEGSPERRVLEIRATLGAKSVQKLYSIKYRLNTDNRIRGIFQFAGADRTARWAGRGPQPQNLPNSGPPVRKCPVCGKLHWTGLKYCGSMPIPPATKEDLTDWGAEAVELALQDIATRNIEQVEAMWGDAIAAVAGCLRGLFTAAPGHDLICSDYSAIEAVALAMLAGETWREEVFRSHGKIYEASASMAYGVPLEEILAYKKRTGNHHPLRKKGKVRELAGGYGGASGAWVAFGADKVMGEEEIVADVRAWRKESPNIVKYWWAIGDIAVAAVQNPGKAYTHRGIKYYMVGDVLYCQLHSGRCLTYHAPRLTRGRTKYGRETWDLSYMGHNSDYTKGPMGWARLDTYGPKLVENITQATCRDILGYAMPRLEAAGYPVVLHVHDEAVSEVPKGSGSVEEFEYIMGTLPPWCADWPIKAAGGWRGLRYRKD